MSPDVGAGEYIADGPGVANPVVWTEQQYDDDVLLLNDLGVPGPRDYEQLARWNYENRDLALAMYHQLWRPRVRYLPTPRLRACRPNAGRSVSRSSRPHVVMFTRLASTI